MRYLNESVEKAAKHCVEELRHNGGIGGVIALDHKGHGNSSSVSTPSMFVLRSSLVAMPMNCSGMYRGLIKQDGVPKVAIFDDDELE